MVGGIQRFFISPPNFSLESNSLKHVSFLSAHIKPENTLTSPHLHSLLKKSITNHQSPPLLPPSSSPPATTSPATDCTPSPSTFFLS
ncbi:hypothetical protein HanIR_Chr07g0300091 [Helianthus annuus]|nr:hypothetical protein HanIR_Chr07g0300091 [Helianthus annuus]